MQGEAPEEPFVIPPPEALIPVEEAEPEPAEETEGTEEIEEMEALEATPGPADTVGMEEPDPAAE